MKYTFIISFISLGLFFTSCNSNESHGEATNIKPDDSTNSTNDFDKFEDFDLRPYEINATLLVPKEERASIKHQLDTYVWKLKIGKQTYITIQDWGTINGFEKYLKQLEEQPETLEFIEKKKGFTLYKLTTGTSKVTYHTAAQHEIDGINYLFESSKQGLSKDGVEEAVISVNSVKLLK